MPKWSELWTQSKTECYTFHINNIIIIDNRIHSFILFRPNCEKKTNWKSNKVPTKKGNLLMNLGYFWSNVKDFSPICPLFASFAFNFELPNPKLIPPQNNSISIIFHSRLKKIESKRKTKRKIKFFMETHTVQTYRRRKWAVKWLYCQKYWILLLSLNYSPINSLHLITNIYLCNCANFYFYIILLQKDGFNSRYVYVNVCTHTYVCVGVCARVCEECRAPPKDGTDWWWRGW